MTRKPLQHAQMDQFPVLDNALQIAGRSIGEVREMAGKTPFYAYDGSVIRGKVASLRKLMPQRLQLHYAVKANPMPELVSFLAGLVDGLDVASAAELKLASATGTGASAISFAGPGKSSGDLRAGIDAGVMMVIESEGEMRRLATIAAERGVRPRVAIRVNPDFQIKSSGMTMGGGAQPFGTDAEAVPALLNLCKDLDLDFYGFHIFCGSQNLNVEALKEAHDATFRLAMELAQSAPAPLRWLNIGGGLGIPYFPGERRLDLKAVADNLAANLARYRAQLADTEIVMELGRFLVGEAGVYVCEVIDSKQSRGQRFLVTNGGLHHNLAASGNFGQVVRRNYPVCIGNKVRSQQMEDVSVVGPLCTPLDILTNKMSLPTADVGDLVVVFQSGAYGYSASPQGFLSHPAAAEIFLDD